MSGGTASAENPGILIVGAGIGGLSLALALEQAGMRATIWERAPELREIGAGLLLTRNAAWVLQRLGLLPEVMAAGRPASEWRILDRHGRRLQTFATGSGELPAISITRSAFQFLLARHLPSETLFLDREVRTISQGKSVTARSSTHEFNADIVVGGDGGRSIVRQQFFSPRPPQAAGYVGWRALVKQVPAGWEHGLITEAWGDGCRFGIAPVSAEKCYWYATENAAPGWSCPVGNRKDHLLQRFRGWHRPIVELIEATPEEEISLSEIAQHSSLARWQNGRVTLLGDAAHQMTPNLGQGAAMALEDAWTLARCLSRIGNDPAALLAYERQRRSRANWIACQSRMLGEIIQLQHPALTFLRDSALRLIPDRLARFALSPVFDFRV